MKVDALYIAAERKTDIRQVEVGAPGPGEIQIEVVACGVCAWDAYLFKGQDNKDPFPYRFGHEAVGFVRELGEGAAKFQKGDAVFCIESPYGGEMAQVINVPERIAGRLPAHVQKKEDFLHTIVEPAVCVVNGIANIPFDPGDSVAIIGTGYMGLLNVQAFRHALAGGLDCFDIDEKKLALAKKYGADNCWVSGSAQADRAVKDVIATGGYDIVVECSGSQPGLQMATDIVKTGGTISNFAWHRGRRDVDASPWHLRSLHIINTGTAVEPFFFRHVDKTARLVAKGVFDQADMVTHVMNYRKIQDMLEIAEAKADGYIKGVITFT